MPPLPRGKCPVCGADVALRRGGLVREHSRWEGAGYKPEKCSGSGKPAAVAEVLQDGSPGADEWPYPDDPPDPL